MSGGRKEVMRLPDPSWNANGEVRRRVALTSDAERTTGHGFNRNGYVLYSIFSLQPSLFSLQSAIVLGFASRCVRLGMLCCALSTLLLLLRCCFVGFALFRLFVLLAFALRSLCFRFAFALLSLCFRVVFLLCFALRCLTLLCSALLYFALLSVASVGDTLCFCNCFRVALRRLRCPVLCTCFADALVLCCFCFVWFFIVRLMLRCARCMLVLFSLRNRVAFAVCLLCFRFSVARISRCVRVAFS